MGNCLALENKVIKVMKTDGEVIEYKAPIKVSQVLSEYPGHAISDELPVVSHLRRNTNMVVGQMYFLLPLPLPRLQFKKKMVRHSKPELVEAGEAAAGSGRVLRIKLVMSKKELEAMLRKGGVSVADLVNSQFEEKESSGKSVHDEGNRNCEPWKPVLESIPEVDQ